MACRLTSFGGPMGLTALTEPPITRVFSLLRSRGTVACTAASQARHKACGHSWAGSKPRSGAPVGDLDNGSGSGSMEEKASQ